ncbi:rRNA maturation RNase YbeY [Helicobacter pylori]|uniref:Endoribonuclease YbeY n=1 Tax=Helicobacter pylori TaxID=210 RepID=A0AAD1DAK5_HELPX|nr:rRNA maturation RNase YbeY [Helicobacter pylori]AVV97435.1 rRNA maturation RNase YbeY [Helicobacter pylori]BBI22571.1 endoribonuclease YbeY [Helicobacter pylori]SQJ04361.1 putative metalloprotease [Helicobacter pylori NCTC 11637 = CCUG 17874 = ATCC 43504 = JCM 12093]
MLEIDNQTPLESDFSLLEKIAKFLAPTQIIELVLVSDETMREINRDLRGCDYVTDVLSFPLEAIPHTPLGSVVINAPLAQENALKLGHRLEEEIALLFIHGVLHLLGYDHEKDKGEQRQKESELIKAFNLPLSLIERAQD